MAYNHKDIEKKWQQRWESEGTFHAKDGDDREKFYCLVEFPYPSGAGLHIGHPRSYTALDVVSRKRRMQGKNVLYPIGWDAFGLPTENYAIKTGRKPQEVTKENVDTFRRQLQSLGISFDWSREVNTTDPEYYKWTQWMFLEFFKAGLAYKKKMAINWCLSCKIGLANEEVVNGACERCGGDVEKRDKEQWMIAITKYADRLLEDLETVDYLEKIKAQQRNWIGKSEGVQFKQKIKDLDIEIEVFDSVPQTFAAQTFAVVAADHPLLPELVRGTENEEAVLAKAEEIVRYKSANKYAEDDYVDGIFTGRYMDDPFGTGDLPIWVASFAIADYGSGFVNCSAHDERDFVFAKKFNIPLRPVMFPTDLEEAEKVRNLEYCYHHADDGVLEAPEQFAGRAWGEVRDEVIAFVESQGWGERAVQYKLRDWVFSRQRYWGEPIPLIWCDACDAWQSVPDDELPVVLPVVEKYEPTDTGESPLAAIEEWVNTTCPSCAGPARRETDTMPNWAGSSWYFLRYVDPHNSEVFADRAKLDYWMPVTLYNGGMEHTTLHLLYSRFWNKFLFDRGHVPTSEPYARRHSHGLVLAEDGTKMSKSKGNVVNPDEIVEQYGADALRMYILFMGPFEEPVPWSLNGLIGVRRFLDKVMQYVRDWSEEAAQDCGKTVEPAIKKVSDDIEAFKFNTAVATFMKLFNELGKQSVTREQLKKILLTLSPFAPHIANECWEMIGEEGLADIASWPEIDASGLIQDEIEIAVQVNGKLRGSILVSPELSEDEMKAQAKLVPNVAAHLEGQEIKKEIVVPGRLINFVV